MGQENRKQLALNICHWEGGGFDAFAEDTCRAFYAHRRGRPSIPPGVYFRMLLVGYLEGIGSERGIAWRCADSISLREFLGYGLSRHPPDHSSVSRTRRRLSLEAHGAVFAWVLQRLRSSGLLSGKTLGVDSTTLDANAALRSIMRRDDASGYEEWLEELARASGLLSGKTLGVDSTTLDGGDCASLANTLDEAEGRLRDLDAPAREMMADKGYHSNATMVALKARGLRGYVSEPNRGRRSWKRNREAQQPTYANRRRVGATAASGCCAGAGRSWSGRSRTCWKPAGCAGCMCAGRTTSANEHCFRPPPSISGCSCDSVMASAPRAACKGWPGRRRRSPGKRRPLYIRPYFRPCFAAWAALWASSGQSLLGPKRFFNRARSPLNLLSRKLLAAPLASIPRLPVRKSLPFLLIALFLAGEATAQTPPRLSVRASQNNVLEGHSLTLTFRLNRVNADRLEYCFMAGGSLSDSLIWEFEPARPANSGYTEITGYIEAGQQEDVVTIRTQDDGTDDIGVHHVLLQYSIGDNLGALTCTQNYTVNNNRLGGALGVYDAHDYYASVDVSVSANSASISEGATAEFVLTRSGGLRNQGALVVDADEVDMDVKFKIRETGYVFPSNFAPWRVKGDANYREISTDPADGETATITMPAGDTEVIVEVDTNNDAVPEIANTAISLTALPGDRPYTILTPTASTLVTDVGDTPSVKIHGPVTDTRVSEAAGHLQFGVQHSISQAPVDLTLRLSTTGDFFGMTPSIQIGVYRSATQPFLQAVSVTPTVLPSGELEFTMPFEEFDADNVTRMVRVALVSDDVDEADGSAALTIPAQHGAASVSSTVTVTDDDLPTVTMTAGSHRIDEGRNVVFTLTRDGNTAVALSIPQQYLTSSFTPSRTVQDAEYPIEFSAGINTATFTVSSADDDIFYTARKLDVTLNPDASAEFRVPDPAPGGSTSDSGADFTRYQLNSVDNDKAKLSMSAATSPVDEADQACFTISVNSVNFHPSIAFVFDVEMSVTEEGSYLASTQERSFRYGITQLGPIESNDHDYDVCLTLDDDLVDEREATVSVEVTGPSNAHVEPATDAKASVTVQDNDGPTLTASLSVAEVHEDNPTDLALHRAGVVDDALTIQAGDFKVEYVYPPEASKQPVTLFENAVTFTANSDTAFSRILLPLDNSYDPGRQIQVTVNANGGSYRVPSTPPANAVADLSDTTKTVYRYPIVEDDHGKLGIRAVTVVIDESQQACYQLYLKNGYIVSPFTATILITDDGDYLDSQQETVLSVYASTLPHDFCIDLDDDNVIEATASISASIHSVSDTDIQTLSGNPAASVVVQDNETPPTLELNAPSSSVDEGQNATIRVQRRASNSTHAATVTVKYGFKGDYYDAPALTTATVTVEAGDEYADLSVPVDEHELHIKNWVLEAELLPGFGYVVGHGYNEVEISVSNDVAIQQLGFYAIDLFTSRDRSWVRESEPRRVFKLGRNKSSSRPNPELTVNVQVREAALSWVSISSGGGVSWGPQNSYDSQPGNARRRGQHTAYPGTRDFQVTFPSGVKQVDIPIEPQDDQLEETASIVQIRVMGGLGYEIISDGEFAETCPGAENYASGCAVDVVPVLNNDDYEHWFQVTPVTPRITEGEDIVFKVERFAIPALHSGLSQPNVSPVCRTSNPQAATQIPVGNIDYRQLLFALSGHESVVGTGNSGGTIDMPPGAMSAEFRLATINDNVGEPESTVEFEILNNKNPQDKYQRPYYCIQSGSGTATIAVEDDDGQPRYTVSATPWTIGESAGETDVTVTVTLDTAATEEVTLNPVIAAGDQEPVQANPTTASDFAVVAQTPEPQITFPVGSRSRSTVVKIRPVSDNFAEKDERLSISVNATDGGGIRPATVRIVDDDTRGVTISETALDIDEGGSGTYTVVLTSEPTADVTVTPFHSAGDADVTVSGVLTFTAVNWNIAQTVTVSAAQDEDTAQDTATIGHSVLGGDYQAASASDVSVTVADDDAAPTEIELAVSIDSVSESAGATTITVTASLNGNALAADTTVAVSVGDSGDSAVSGTDYTAVTDFQVTIATGLTTGTNTFELTATNDTIDEPDETVSITGSVTGFTVMGAAVEITDDDAAPAVTLLLSDASIGEGGGIATVTASLNHASSDPTTVTVSVSPDSPATSSDYSLSTIKVLTIAAESTASTGTVTVTGVDNDLAAADKTVQVKGAAVNDLGVTDPADVELTLEDDDTRGVTVSATALDVDENDTATYTVVLTSQPTGDVTVTPSRESGDTDVTVSGALTFTALNWATLQTVTVSAAHDADALDDTAVIANAVSGGDYGLVAAASVDVTVDDDETPSSGVTLSVSPDSVGEGAVATAITVTATLNGGTRDAATPVAVTADSGTATSGTDFGEVTGITITIPANTASHTGTFSLSPTQDTEDEPDETVEVNGTTTVPGLLVTGAEVEITDDDTAPAVTLLLSDASIGEGGGIVTVTASLDHASSESTTVTVSVAPDTPATSSDYSLSTNTTLTIAANATTSTGTVTVTGVDNDLDAADKTVQVKGAAVNDLGVTDPSDMELTLEDDDTRGVTVSATAVDVDEDDTATYTVVLTSQPTGDVTVTPSRESGDTDVTVSGALTFTALNWATLQTVTVSAAHDADALDDTAVIANAVSGGDYGLVAAASVDVTVDDDETPSSGVTLSVSPDSVGEGAVATAITVTATLNGGTRGSATPVAVTADSGTATSGTDFGEVTGITITIPANTASHTGTFSLSPTQDTEDEPDETVEVNGTTTVPGLLVTGAEVEITDDDTAPAVTLLLSDASIGEGGGIVTVTASLDHASSESTTVTVSVAPDTPATSSDYSLSTNTTLTIAANATTSTGTVTITGVDNDLDAADKTVQVKGAAVNDLGVTDPSDVQLTLEDNDARGVTVSATAVDVDEDDTATYTVVLTSQPTGDVTVTPSRESGDTDVTVSGALTFTALNWATLQTVTVSAAHDADALDDTAVIANAVSGGDYGLVAAASVDVTVDDDETPSSGVTLSVSPDSVGEGAVATAITVTAALNGGTRDVRRRRWR